MANEADDRPAEEPQILPCPFCGSAPGILRGLTRKRLKEGNWNEVQYTAVRCSNTGCVIWRRDLAEDADICLTDKDAVTAWNRQVRILLSPKDLPPG